MNISEIIKAKPFYKGSGSAGAPGSQTYYGSSIPLNTFGNDGDVFNYINNGDSTDPLNWNEYQRQTGVWTLMGNKQGRQGDQGDPASASLNGPIVKSVDPIADDGKTGDSFINSTTNYMFTPKGGTSSRSPQFLYGVNVHLGQTTGAYAGMTNAKLGAELDYLGADVIRDNCASSSALSSRITNFANPLLARGVKTIWVIDVVPSFTNTYSANYAIGNTLGLAWGTASLAYDGTVYVSITNESDNSSAGNIRKSAPPTSYAGSVNPGHLDGSVYGDYDATKLEALRGYIHGVFDGIKANNPAAKIGCSSGCSFPNVYADMLMNGRGVADGPTVPGIGGYTNGPVIAAGIPFDWWDMHYYWTQFNPTAGQSWHYNYPSTSFNVLALLNTVTGGIPIYIGEWGGGSQADAQKSASTTQYFNTYWNALKATYNIQGIIYYQLYALAGDSTTNNYGLIQPDGVTRTTTYQTLKGLYTSNTTSVPGGWAAAKYQLPLIGDLPSVIGLGTGGTGLVDIFKTTNTPFKLRIWNAGDKTNGDFAYLGFAADNIARLNTGKLGTGTARAWRFGLNDVDLLALGASTLNALTNNSYSLGTSALRFQHICSTTVNNASQVYTATTTLVATSPACSVINSAGAVVLTVPASPVDGDERYFTSIGSSTTAGVSYTGVQGAVTYTFAAPVSNVPKYLKLKWIAALNYWLDQGHN